MVGMHSLFEDHPHLRAVIDAVLEGRQGAVVCREDPPRVALPLLRHRVDRNVNGHSQWTVLVVEILPDIGVGPEDGFETALVLRDTDMQRCAELSGE